MALLASPAKVCPPLAPVDISLCLRCPSIQLFSVYIGKTVYHFMGTSTFSEYTVLPEISVAKVSQWCWQQSVSQSVTSGMCVCLLVV